MPVEPDVSTKPDTTDGSEARRLPGLSDALRYPIRNHAWMMVVIGAVIALIPDLFSGINYLGFLSWILGLAYFNVFYFSIVEWTVSGKDDPPDWPDVTSVTGDLLLPLFRTVRAAVLALFPFLTALWLRDNPYGMWRDPWVLAGIAWAVLYFPMAMLNAIVTNDMMTALPHHVLPRLFRAMPQYLLLVGILAAGLAVSWLLAGSLSRLPAVGGFLSSAAAIYFMMVEARLAGTFYRHRTDFMEEISPSGLDED